MGGPACNMPSRSPWHWPGQWGSEEAESQVEGGDIQDRSGRPMVRALVPSGHRVPAWFPEACWHLLLLLPPVMERSRGVSTVVPYGHGGTWAWTGRTTSSR